MNTLPGDKNMPATPSPGVHFGLGGRVVVVTGAAQGIGQACARRHLAGRFRALVCAAGRRARGRRCQAAQGIGQACARRLVRDGAAVALWDVADAAWTLHEAARIGHDSVAWPLPYASGRSQYLANLRKVKA